MPSLQRHFTFKHPLFRARKSSTGVWRENSVYYLWWEFLRRHDGYKRTCENGGTGQYAKLYADFGDVHSGNFREWWMKDDRGARLFAEPALPNSVTSISLSDIDESLSEAWKSGALLVIAIPLALRKRFISQKINKLLKQQHHRRRGQRTFKESRGLYPIACQHDIGSLQTTLAAYDLRNSQHHPKLWEIAQQLKLAKDNLLTKDELASKARETDAISDKKIRLQIAASKKLHQAEKIFDGVGRGKFPAISTGKKRNRRGR
jgi:hypothetical protein